MEAKILVSTIPSTTWTNVFHFTKKDNKANYGDRLPAVWIHKSGFFHICSAVSGNKNFCKNKPFQRNRLYSIRIQQAKNGDYSINVDGIELYKGKNTTPKDFNNVKVYTSDPWYEPFTTKYGILKNFRYTKTGKYEKRSIHCDFVIFSFSSKIHNIDHEIRQRSKYFKPIPI